jgi:hypothetical protein
MRRTPAATARVHDLGALAVEIGEIEVAMAVHDLEWCVGHVSASGVRGAGSGGGNGQPRGGPVEIEEHIEDERGRVKVDRLAAGRARGEVGGQFGPGAGSGGVGGEAGQDRCFARHDGRGRLARGTGARQPGEKPVEQRKRQVEPRLRPARARGIGEFERRGRPCPAGSPSRSRGRGKAPAPSCSTSCTAAPTEPSARAAMASHWRRRARPEAGLISAATRSSAQAGRSRSVRQRERIVGKRPEGWCEIRNITVFAGGSSSSFRSALAADGFISSAQSTMTTRRPPGRQAEKSLEAAHFVDGQLRLEAFAVVVPCAAQEQQVGLRQRAHAAGDGVFGSMSRSRRAAARKARRRSSGGVAIR